MRNFPVIKDLVVDTDNAMNKFRQAMPYTDIQTKKSDLAKEYGQTPSQRKKLEQTSQCIKCMLCYSACPVYGLDNEFVGPAAGALAQRYNHDNRDKIRNNRMDSMTTKKGIFKCSYVGECSVACPKNVDPGLALQKLKIMGVLHLAKKIVKIKK
jgi:fumarate reductase iron-sulfur subunit